MNSWDKSKESLNQFATAWVLHQCNIFAGLQKKYEQDAGVLTSADLQVAGEERIQVASLHCSISILELQQSYAGTYYL